MPVTWTSWITTPVELVALTSYGKPVKETAPQRNPLSERLVIFVPLGGPELEIVPSELVVALSEQFSVMPFFTSTELELAVPAPDGE